MRIQLKVSGGISYFPGLNQPIVIDSDALPSGQVDRLKHLLNRVHFFDLPSLVNAPAPGAADYRQYTITVDDGDRHHTVQATDPIENPELRALLDFLQEQKR